MGPPRRSNIDWYNVFLTAFSHDGAVGAGSSSGSGAQVDDGENYFRRHTRRPAAEDAVGLGPDVDVPLASEGLGPDVDAPSKGLGPDVPSASKGLGLDLNSAFKDQEYDFSPVDEDEREEHVSSKDCSKSSPDLMDEDEQGEHMSSKDCSKLSPNLSGEKKNNGKVPLNKKKIQGHGGKNKPSVRDHAIDSEEFDYKSSLPSRSSKRTKKQLRNSSSAFSGKVQEVVLLDDEDMEPKEEVNREMSDRLHEQKIYYPSRDDEEAVELTRSDIKYLDPEVFLSSPVINFYIKYIKRTRLRDKFFIFNTYFYGKLEEALHQPGNFPKLRRWWKGVNIFNNAYIIMPVHGREHWSLVIICLPPKERVSEPVILHLDSLGMHRSAKILKTVERFVEHEWCFLADAEAAWPCLLTDIRKESVQVPQQNNAYDCGIFMLYYIEQFIKEAPARFTTDKLGMFNCSWFQPEEASGLRQRIREVLLEEFERARLDDAIQEADASEGYDNIKDGKLEADDNSIMVVEVGVGLANIAESNGDMKVVASEEASGELGDAVKSNGGIRVVASSQEASEESQDASKSIEGMKFAASQEANKESGDAVKSIGGIKVVESQEASEEFLGAGMNIVGMKVAELEEASEELGDDDKSTGGVKVAESDFGPVDEDVPGQHVSSKDVSKLPPEFSGEEQNNSKLHLNKKKSQSHGGKKKPSVNKQRASAIDPEESDYESSLPSRSSKRRKQQFHNSSSAYSGKVQDVVPLDDEDMEPKEKVNCDMSDRLNELKTYYPSRDDEEVVKLTRSDIKYLDPGVFLSSPVINFYIKYIKRTRLCNENFRDKFYIFNTYFYGKLEEALHQPGDFPKLRKWWKGANIFNNAYIILPVQGREHWSLVIICLPPKKRVSEPIILHLDSLGMHHSAKILKTVKRFVEHEWCFLADTEAAWPCLLTDIRKKSVQVPQQNNAYDCGIFMLYYIEQFIKQAPARFTTDKLGMFNRSWFKPEEAYGLRQRISELLLEEFERARLDDAVQEADAFEGYDGIKDRKLEANDSSIMVIQVGVGLGGIVESNGGMKVATSEEASGELGDVVKSNGGIKAAISLQEASEDSQDASDSIEGTKVAASQEASKESGDAVKSTGGINDVASEEASEEFLGASMNIVGMKVAELEEKLGDAVKSTRDIQVAASQEACQEFLGAGKNIVGMKVAESHFSLVDEDVQGKHVSSKDISKLPPEFSGEENNNGKVHLNKKKRQSHGGKKKHSVNKQRANAIDPEAFDYESSLPSRSSKRRKHQLRNSSYFGKVQDVVLLDDEDMEPKEEVNRDMSERLNEPKIYYPSRDDEEVVKLTRSDIKYLDPEVILSSPVINFYIKYIKRTRLCDEYFRDKFYIFNTYFYGKLEEALHQPGDFPKLRRWWKGVNIFNNAYIILPVHVREHWSLVIICLPPKKRVSEPIILHVDFLGMHRSAKILKTVERFVEHEWCFLADAEAAWPCLLTDIRKKSVQVPQQNNAYDCGIFMLYYIEQFIKEAPARFTTDKLGKINPSWFKPEEASGLRQRIRELLLKEFERARQDDAIQEADASDGYDDIKDGKLEANGSSIMVVEVGVGLGNIVESNGGMKVEASEEASGELGYAVKSIGGIKVVAASQEASEESQDASKGIEGMKVAVSQEARMDSIDAIKSTGSIKVAASHEASEEFQGTGMNIVGMNVAESEEASEESGDSRKSTGGIKLAASQEASEKSQNASESINVANSEEASESDDEASGDSGDTGRTNKDIKVLESEEATVEFSGYPANKSMEDISDAAALNKGPTSSSSSSNCNDTLRVLAEAAAWSESVNDRKGTVKKTEDYSGSCSIAGKEGEPAERVKGTTIPDVVSHNGGARRLEGNNEGIGSSSSTPVAPPDAAVCEESGTKVWITRVYRPSIAWPPGNWSRSSGGSSRDALRKFKEHFCGKK